MCIRDRDPGLRFARLEAASLFEAGAAALDGAVAAYLRTRGVLMTACPLTGTAGERAYLLQSMVATYRHGARIGEMVKADLSGASTDLWTPGTILYNGSVSVTSSGTAFQVGAVASGKTLYGGIHVLSGSGSLTARIQSDDNGGFSSATTQITFTAITGTTYEWAMPVAGPVTDDWWRANFTVSSGGPFTVVLSMGIL